MTSTLQGIGMSLAMSKVGKIKAVEATQTKFSDIGTGFGTSVGNKIKTGFGGGIDTFTTTPHVDTPNVKQPEVEVKAPETEVKTPATEVKAPEAEVKTPATEVKAPEAELKTPANNETDTPNGRTTHTDEPEVEPGIVAKEPTAEGHEIKVLKDGRVVKCSECGEIKLKYEEQLKQNPELKNRLDKIEKISDPQEKAKQAKQLEQELSQAPNMQAVLVSPQPKQIDLHTQEGLGGHSIDRHGAQVKLSELRQRVLGTHPTHPQSRSAMKFNNEHTHANSVEAAYLHYKTEIDAHFAAGGGYKEWTFDYGSQTGVGFTNTGTRRNPSIQAVTTNKVTISLKAHSAGGFYLESAFPAYP
jgi:hypothetical protein